MGETSTPPSLNRYLYAYSNPTIYFDPTGHAPILDEAGQGLIDTGKRLLDNVDEDSGILETAFFGFTAGANYFVGGVIETVNFGVNIATSTSLFGDATRARANSELDEAFGTIHHLTTNKAQVASEIGTAVKDNVVGAYNGDPRSQANIISTVTGLVGSKGQNSILSANRTAAVANATKTVSTALKNSKAATTVTGAIERAVTSGGNAINGIGQSAVEGLKKTAQALAENASKASPQGLRRQLGAVGPDVSKVKIGQANKSNDSIIKKKKFSAVDVNGRKIYKNSVDVTSSAPQFVHRSVHKSIREKINNGWTNLDLMRNGNAPIGPDGKQINLHHVLGKEPGPMVELTTSIHKKHHGKLHGLVEDGNSFRNNSSLQYQYETFRKSYWKERAKDFE